jgi:hypothetical protein
LDLGWTRPKVEADREEDTTMRTVDVQEYARQLLEAHGDRAVVEAAQKARQLEQEGAAEEARTWRRIEAALLQMRGPHAS